MLGGNAEEEEQDSYLFMICHRAINVSARNWGQPAQQPGKSRWDEDEDLRARSPLADTSAAQHLEARHRQSNPVLSKPRTVSGTNAYV